MNQNNQSTFLSYVAETTPGETPATPTMKKLRTTNPLALSPSKALLESEEVFAHRQRQNVMHGMKSVGGNIPTELSYAAFADWFESLLGGSWSAGVLKVGNAVKTFTVEQAYPQIGEYLQYLGVTPSQVTITINPTGLVTAAWDIVGMNFDSASTSLGSPEDVANHPPFQGLAKASLTEGGSAIATITQMTIVINANKSVGGLVGSDGGDTPSDGQVQVTGNIQARFKDQAVFEKFKNETESELSVELTNPAGDETLTFEMPRVKYNSGTFTNNDNTVDAQFDYEALYDETESSSIVITEDDGVV